MPADRSVRPRVRAEVEDHHWGQLDDDGRPAKRHRIAPLPQLNTPPPRPLETLPQENQDGDSAHQDHQDDGDDGDSADQDDQDDDYGVLETLFEETKEKLTKRGTGLRQEVKPDGSTQPVISLRMGKLDAHLANIVEGGVGVMDSTQSTLCSVIEGLESLENVVYNGECARVPEIAREMVEDLKSILRDHRKAYKTIYREMLEANASN